MTWLYQFIAGDDDGNPGLEMHGDFGITKCRQQSHHWWCHCKAGIENLLSLAILFAAGAHVFSRRCRLLDMDGTIYFPAIFAHYYRLYAVHYHGSGESLDCAAGFEF